MKTLDDLKIDVPEAIEKYTNHSIEIGIIIANYIRSNRDMTKSKFAKEVDTTEAEVDEWISGNYNFSILTLSLIESKTGLSIIKNLNEQQIEAFRNDNTFIL